VQQPHLKLALAALTLMAALSCSNPSGPTPPPPSAAPAIACPADVQAGAVEGTIAVQYPAPQATGGTAPVAVSCTMPSGAEFPVGSTTIACTATDSTARSAQCSFRVNVSLIPRLKGTKIVAFGDSITAGVVSAPATAAIRIDLPDSYPSVLRQLLQDRYTSQDIVMINEGLPGEQVLGTGSASNGEGRIERLALQYKPDVLIILEGVNGLSVSNAEDIAAGLRRGVRRARATGVPLIIVSTILPGVAGRPKAPDPAAVDILNAEIRGWAGSEGAVLVDMFGHVNPQKELLIGQDGLHPTVAGYVRMAEVFRDVIQAVFEVPPAAPPTPPAGLVSGAWR
jgi:lysophospholipase L1-like esterase